MKNTDFKNFLFKSAVLAMACDGEIVDEEIEEIKNIVENEIHFMGFDFEIPLKNNIEYIRNNGTNAFSNYLNEIVSNNLNEHQEIMLIDVILRVIHADIKIDKTEISFLKKVISKLKLDEQSLIVKFPYHINYLIGFDNNEIKQEFTD